MMQHHVEIHSDWISCRLTTVGPTVVWHLSASEVLSRSWRHSKWGGACAHVAQRTPCIQIHCTEFDLTWQCLRSCHCEITCVYLHPEAATAPAWSCYRIYLWYLRLFFPYRLGQSLKHLDTRRSTYAKHCTIAFVKLDLVLQITLAWRTFTLVHVCSYHVFPQQNRFTLKQRQ